MFRWKKNRSSSGLPRNLGPGFSVSFTGLEFPLELDFEEIVLPEELGFFFLQFLTGTCHVFHGSRFESRWDLDFLLNILSSYYQILMRTFLEASD